MRFEDESFERQARTGGSDTSLGAEPEAAEAAGQFLTAGDVQDVRAHTVGHIHRSFLVTCSKAGRQARYLLQRINTEVFVDPGALMRNISIVTDHLRSRAALAPLIVPARDGSLLWTGRSGKPWRCYEHVEECSAVEVAHRPEQAREAGRAFGSFERLLSDLDPASLAETIPRFHDVSSRLDQLEEAVRKDPVGRAAGVEAELATVGRHSQLAEVAAQLDGALPRRVVHYDCKISNVLFDASSGRARCVVDLDTVMPGTVIWDFGDLVRSVACESAEDATDLLGMTARIEVVSAAAAGYLTETAVFITEDERSALSFAGAIATFEQAVRFLADYIGGDTYFRISRPGHNLARARAQLAMLDSLVGQQDQLDRALRAAWEDIGEVG